MTQEAFIDQAKQLIAIQSTDDNPAALQEACNLIIAHINACGKDITIEQFERGGKPSLLAYSSRTRPKKFRIMFNGHLDVVSGTPEQYTATIANNRLYGRGAYDMKTAALVMAEVFCEFADKVPYALGLQLTTDEERSGINGTQYQIEQGVRSDFIICGECGRLPGEYEIANEAKGIVLATLEFAGASAHGAYPWNGGNAAMKAAQFASKLHERFPTPSAATGETTVTVTSIVSTSGAHNKIPDHASATIDARYTAGDPNFQNKAQFEALMREFDPEVQVVAYEGFSGPMYTSPKNPLLLALKSAAESSDGQAYTLTKRNGSNDGRYYSDVGGQACEFGIPGKNQHGDNEYVALEAITGYRNALAHFLRTTITMEHERAETI